MRADRPRARPGTFKSRSTPVCLGALCLALGWLGWWCGLGWCMVGGVRGKCTVTSVVERMVIPDVPRTCECLCVASSRRRRVWCRKIRQGDVAARVGVGGGHPASSTANARTRVCRGVGAEMHESAHAGAAKEARRARALPGSSGTHSTPPWSPAPCRCRPWGPRATRPLRSAGGRVVCLRNGKCWRGQQLYAVCERAAHGSRRQRLRRRPFSMSN